MATSASRCCAPGCANPFLTWHSIGPDEAVPLCLTHAKQAVDTAAPPERLRALARAAASPAQRDRGRPAWQMRNLLVRVAGNFFYETPVLFRLGSVTCIGFNRGEEGNLQLTLRMPTTSGQPRAAIIENVWQVPPDGAEVLCPPSGRLLDITYPDGDRFRVEFTDVAAEAALQARFGKVARWAYRLTFPLTLVELAATVTNTDLDFGPHHCRFGGPPTVDCFTSHGDAAIDVPLTQLQLDGLFPQGLPTA